MSAEVPRGAAIGCQGGGGCGACRLEGGGRERLWGAGRVKLGEEAWGDFGVVTAEEAAFGRESSRSYQKVEFTVERVGGWRSRILHTC